ncbi:siderophore-interacting protein [Pseudobdellovibrio exovorus]|uniref:FAD-binding FR-type domain-containing protein n=1 Tax=Pseudobdellovibrio exovorus JSS TaxID=1184267 RepID=M4V957_9BACT|nr:siderophore-interacting protein [Pseudobdellovibrio exovorus]AGH94541.1 hypothetical protein A11Q_321 [Pseudobdellovibrio exovorus JSS]
MDREVKTVMHSIKFRTLTVKEIKMLNPKMKEVTFTSEDLQDFVSASPDDHIKLFFPYPDEEVAQKPDLSKEATESSRPPIMRDYTPRAYNNEKQELIIDFFLHAEGAGANWARQAQVGSKLLIAGPRGSRVVPYTFDGYWLIGDESFMPSVARRLEEIPADIPVDVVLILNEEENKIALPERKNLKVQWFYKASAQIEDYVQILSEKAKPQGDYYAWVGCEKQIAMALKDVLAKNFGFNPEWVSAKGYWSK